LHWVGSHPELSAGFLKCKCVVYCSMRDRRSVTTLVINNQVQEAAKPPVRSYLPVNSIPLTRMNR